LLFRQVAYSKGLIVVESTLTIAEQLAEAVSFNQTETTGHSPKRVKAVISENVLVVTLVEGLTPAETVLSQNELGAASLQEFHRSLFASTSESLRSDVERITGRRVRDSTPQVVTEDGSLRHTFASGTVVQIFLLAPDIPPES
jgi:uncharacterized protein YbcI